MKPITFQKAARLTSYITFSGSVLMILGAVLLQISGADLDHFLNQGSISGYLEKAGENRLTLITNLSFWITGVILIGAGAILMVRLAEDNPFLNQLTMYNYTIAIPIVVISYMAWMTLVVLLAHGGVTNQATLAGVVGWFASRTDWVATVLILGTGPVLISLAGSGTWVPKWLKIWSFLALFTGLLNVIAQFTNGMTSYGFLIIPVGMGWMFAVSVVLFRLGRVRE